MLTQIKCSICGAIIGAYIEQDKVCIQVGNVLLRDAWGWCKACGAEWIWHSSDKQLEQLIAKIKKPVDEYFNP